MNTKRIFSLAFALVLATHLANASVIPLDFVGNAGTGLLPGNEVGEPTPVGQGVDTPAIGGEIGDGLLYDTDTNTFDFWFEFSNLSGGLFDAASGIHFHIGAPGVDPFNETGGIALNLNSGTDSDVTLATDLIAIGSTGGTVRGSAILTDDEERQLLDGNFYLNIHSGDFNGGELRGNVSAVPEPTTLGVWSVLLGCFVVACRARRRRSE